eukprot:13069363-Alexandrium_andersonii.AAC.1
MQGGMSRGVGFHGCGAVAFLVHGCETVDIVVHGCGMVAAGVHCCGRPAVAGFMAADIPSRVFMAVYCCSWLCNGCSWLRTAVAGSAVASSRLFMASS